MPELIEEIEALAATEPPSPTEADVRGEIEELSAKVEAPAPIIGPEQVGLPPRSTWESLGRIGLGERLSHEGLMEAVTGRVPFLGPLVTFGNLSEVKSAADRLKKAQERGVDLVKDWESAFPAHERDTALVMRFFYEQEMAQKRGYTLGSDVATVAADALPFMAEFLVTGGAAKLARVGTKKALRAGIGAAARKGVGRLGVGLVGTLASGTTRTLLSPGRVAASFARRRLPEHFGFDQEGRLVIGQPKESAPMAFVKAFGDVLVEMISEEAGERVGRSAARYLRHHPQLAQWTSALRDGLRKAWMGATGGTASQFTRKMVREAGFNGILMEIGEERLGDTLRALLNIEDFGAEDGNVLERLVASLPNGRQLAVEGLAFSIPGVARRGLLALSNRADRMQMESLLIEDDDAMGTAADILETFGEKPKEKEFAAALKKAYEAGEEPPAGLRKRVLRAAGKIVDAAATEEPAPPVVEEEAAKEEIGEESGEEPEQKPTVAPQRLVAERPAPPTVEEKAAPPKAEKVEKPKPLVNEEVAKVGAEEAREFAEEATPTEAAVEDIPQPELEKLGIREVRGGKGAGSRYTVRSTEGEHPLERAIAAHLAEPEQSIRDIIAVAQDARAELGQETMNRALQILHNESSPQARKTKKRKALYTALDFQPEVGGEAGGLPAETVMAEYERLRKILPRETLRKLMRDVTFWERGTPINVTAQKLEAYARRQVMKPKSAFRLGAISKQMEDKQILEYIKKKMPEREYKMIASALERVVKSRTPRERGKVLEAINRMIERHNVASARADLKAAVKDAKSAGLRSEYEKALDDLLENVALTKPSKKSILSAAKTLAAAAAQIREQYEEGGIPAEEAIVSIPVKVINKAEETLRRARARALTELDSEEIRDLERAVKVIAHSSQLKSQMLASRARKTAAEQIEGAAQAVTERHGLKPADVQEGRLLTRATGAIKRVAILEQRSYENIVNLLVGQNPAYKVLYENLRKGDATTVGIVDAAAKAKQQALNDMGLNYKDLRRFSTYLSSQRAADTVHVRISGGRTLHLTRADRMGLFLNLQDPSTLAEILDDQSRGILLRVDEQAGREPTKITAADAVAISESLTSQERRLALWMRTYLYENVAPLVNKEFRKQYGIDSWTEDRHWHRSREGKEVTEPVALIREWQDRMLSQQGAFKRRTGTKRAVVIDDAFKTFNDMLLLGANFVGKDAATKDALRIIRSRAFRQAVKSRVSNGNAILGIMENVLRDYVGLDRMETSGFNQFFNGLIRRLQVSALGLRPHIVAYQTISLLSATNEISEKYIRHSGLLKASNKDTRAEMEQWSPLMWNRITGSGHRILTPGSSLSSIADFWGRKENLISRTAMGLIQKADTQVMYRIWRAAKLEAQARGLSGDALMRETARRAQEIVDRTQPTWDVLTISQLQRYGRKHAWAKLAMMFSSQRNKNFNMAMRALDDYAASNNKQRDFLPMVRKVLVPTLINAFLLYMIKFGWDRLKGKKEDQPVLGGVLGVANRMAGNWLIGGDMASAAIRVGDAVRKGRPVFFVDTTDNVLESGGKEFLDALYYTLQGFADASSEKISKRNKASAKFWKGLEHFIRGASMFSGVPVQGPVTDIKDLLKEKKK